jgi:hypothetical protein
MKTRGITKDSSISVVKMLRKNLMVKADPRGLPEKKQKKKSSKCYL